MMRLQQLQLGLFGHFTSKEFDFGEHRSSDSDFHVIYGPNEAGKTTIMEAYLRLLYGFQKSEPYDFQHQRKNLNVSGTLELDGEPLTLTRLPQANLLKDEHGQTLPEGILQSHLDGLLIDDYRKLLCIDDHTIEEGGKEIVSSKGDIGTLLFSAAAGIGDLSMVLKQVRINAHELYLKRATKSTYANLRKDHAEINKRIRELDIPVSTYRRLKRNLDKAIEAEQQVEDDRASMLAEQVEITALLDALPLLAEIKRLDDDIEPLSAYPNRLEIQPEELVEMLPLRANLNSNIARLADEIATLDTRLETLEIDTKQLDLGDELEALEPLRSAYIVAETELDLNRKKHNDLVQEMERVTSDLGIAGNQDPLSLVVPSSTLVEFEKIIELLDETTLRVENEQTEIDRLNNSIATATSRRQEIDNIHPIEIQLAEILELFNADELINNYTTSMQLIDGMTREYQAALDALSLKGQVFETTPHCSLDTVEVEEILNHMQELSLELKTAEQELDRLKSEQIAINTQIEKLENSVGLADDTQANALKLERNRLWTSHKKDLLLDSAEKFELSMHKLDTATAARLTHASELGTLRQLKQTLTDLSAKAKRATSRQDVLSSDIEEQEKHLQQAASMAGLNHSISPKAFLAWLRKLDLCTSLGARLQREKSTQKEIFEKADKLKVVLSEHINRESPSLSELITVAKKIVAEQQDYKEKLRAEELQIKSATVDLKRREQNRTCMLKRNDEQQTQWEQMIFNAFNCHIRTDILRNSLQPLRELRELDKERIGIARQITTMEESQRLFGIKMNSISERFSISNGNTPLETFSELKKLTNRAQKSLHDAERWKQKRRKISAEHSLESQTLKNMNTRINQLGKLFPDEIPSESLDELRVAVNQTESVIKLREHRTATEKELLTLLNLSHLDDARLTLNDLNPNDLTARLGNLKEALSAKTEHYKSAIEERVNVKKDLESIKGDAEVAQLVERRTAIELAMSNTMLEHLKLVTGFRLAEEAIRRYRDTHRSDMLRATEKAFAELTNGAYSKLLTQHDGTSEVLVAVDASGLSKQANDMSKGTRFQLYLSLRAAAYEQLAAQGTCLPFICDDIFETFDEERTESACRVMERIGRTGQAIYLTHHKHVVEIASEVCKDTVTIHNI